MINVQHRIWIPEVPQRERSLAAVSHHESFSAEGSPICFDSTLTVLPLRNRGVSILARLPDKSSLMEEKEKRAIRDSLPHMCIPSPSLNSRLRTGFVVD